MSNTIQFFKDLVKGAKAKDGSAICSVCSANGFVIEAALEEGLKYDKPVLVEATANQVNQFGGYTGMLPSDFVDYVNKFADNVGFDKSRILFGGDHLGPLVWCEEDEASAMEKAKDLIAVFAKAGFGKIHIDCSMRLGSDDVNAPLKPETVAERAAILCEVAEKNSPIKPVYIVGSEVPIPGGAREKEDSLAVTAPEDLESEYKAFKDAFLRHGLEDAWERVSGVVVQPGVEFGDDQIFLYDSEKAKILTDKAREIPGIVLEGHSTDYQSAACLTAMKKDGIAILKVGPALTFAVRQALFALESIEKAIYRNNDKVKLSNFSGVLEEEMLKNPKKWNQHYFGDDETVYLMRKYSLSDRARYYMDEKAVQDSIAVLLKNINAVEIPHGLLKQFMPEQALEVVEGTLKPTAEALVKAQVKYVLRSYEA